VERAVVAIVDVGAVDGVTMVGVGATGVHEPVVAAVPTLYDVLQPLTVELEKKTNSSGSASLVVTVC